MTRTLFEGGRNGDETARVRRLKLVRLAETCLTLFRVMEFY